MKEISDNIFFESKYMGCNTGCIITGEGIVLIDTPALPEGAADWLAQIKQVTDKGIACTIYTHEHFDHVLGSAYLTRNIIAHQAAVEDIEYLKTNLAQEITAFFPDIYKMFKATWDATEVVSPRMTFSNKMTLNIGGKKIVLSLAGGHSPASILVYLPMERVLFCGDLADKGMPFVTPYSKLGEWTRALRRVEMMAVDVIVPGHGDLCTREDVSKVRVYFEALRHRLGALKSKGVNKEKALQEINVDDCLPAPRDETTAGRVAIDARLMWQEIP